MVMSSETSTLTFNWPVVISGPLLVLEVELLLVSVLSTFASELDDVEEVVISSLPLR
jgi:hypothetical protein